MQLKETEKWFDLKFKKLRRLDFIEEISSMDI